MSVYFAQREKGGLIKIGWSESVPNRMSALKTKLIGAVPGGESTESELHERFKHLRVRGEWFTPDNELLAYIRDEAQDHEPDHKNVQTAIRLSDNTLERADKIAERMSKETGLNVSRTEVLRIAIDQGMKQLEDEGKKRKKR